MIFDSTSNDLILASTSADVLACSEPDGSEDSRTIQWSGTVLADRYRLRDQIGVGGYGVVFSAIDEQLGIPVAVKILSPAVAAEPRMLARFRREALSANRIRHQGVIRIFDSGTESDGTSYIVMEHLDGIDLADALKAHGRLSTSDSLSIAIQCAQALAAAHRQKILHRDLKPANIFLVGEGDKPDVRIIDFGIAKDLGERLDQQHITSVSKVVGTPYYMAPEQAKGSIIDERADIYALGVILFEMLTGTKPFEGESSLEILMGHVEGPRRAPSSVQPSIASAPGLDKAVLKAIAADRNERFESMEEFSSVLLMTLGRIDRTGTRLLQPRRIQPSKLSRFARSTERTALNDPLAKTSSTRFPLRLKLLVAVLLLAIIASAEATPPAAEAPSTPIDPTREQAAPNQAVPENLQAHAISDKCLELAPVIASQD